MNELKAILYSIPFWFYEKYKLRQWQGTGRASNVSYPKRNEVFYTKLNEKLLPLLSNYGFKKVKKRRFLRHHGEHLFFIELDLTKRCNGMKIGYGKLSLSNQFNENSILDDATLMTYGQLGNDVFYLKPPSWQYDYEYPIRKNDTNDGLMINEIVHLLEKVISTDFNLSEV